MVITNHNSQVELRHNRACFNIMLQGIQNPTFPNELRDADISPVYKKKGRHDESDYRPVSILPLLSRPFERILYEQTNSHAKDMLWKYQEGFQTGFSSQHSKEKKLQDNGESCGALLVYLSKGFGCIVRDLLLAKLSAYGLDCNSLKLINSFLNGRKFKAKIGSSNCTFLDFLVGVPQG